ncbi:hypothetical protein H8L32_21715 [Undibacterium sp. CY18W]|uniref:Bacteriophage CII protein n=1 Tax=Undibacterium hunanense TaxID=2762292 RepID=A0ABR6ZX18_9BURK|nr:hypothetical protein [Undibacterium hunanense]MBC3920100.1 hypothetical protein [Undibacterium hunanense]
MSNSGNEPLFSRKPTIQLSDEQLTNARRIEAALLQQVHKTKVCTIADAFGVCETTAGRWVNDGELTFLAVIGVEAVPAEHAYSPRIVEALMTIAGTKIAQAGSAEEFFASLKVSQ